jgi:hypothetical protein
LINQRAFATQRAHENGRTLLGRAAESREGTESSVNMSLGISDVARNTNPPSNDSLQPIRSQLNAIAERYAIADRRAKQALTMQDRAAAEWERLEAAGDYTAAEMDLAGFLLLLFRTALRHQPDALRQYLVRAIRPELDAITETIAYLEGRGK